MKGENRNRKIKQENKNNFIIVGIVILIIAIILAVTITCNGKKNEPNDADDKKIAINISPKEEVSLGVGYSTYLFAMVEGVPDAFVSWISSDTSIATVYNGTVIGIKKGKVTITATYNKDGKEYKTSKDITVVEGNSSVELKDISFPNGELYMPINGEYQLNIILTPANAFVDSKIFSSSNPEVATVSLNGMVKGIKEGHTLITVDVNNIFKKSIDVYVGSNYTKSEIIASPDSITFNTNTMTIKVGNSEKINYTLTPNINYSHLTWESSNSNVVSVSQNGIIKGVSVGSAIVSLFSINGKRDDINIEVVNNTIEINDIKLTENTINMKAGDRETIVPIIMPSNATNKNLSYESSNSNIVSVSVNPNGQSAIVSALSEGNATITINGGNIEKKINVTVTGNNVTPPDDPSQNDDKTIKVSSNKNNLATTYDAVKNIGVSGTTTITITLGNGVSKIKYCLNRNDAGASCTPNILMYSSSSITVPSGSIYALKIKKYDLNNNEITSTSSNYQNGMLNYYINTGVTEEIKTKQYEITGAYFNTAYSKAYPLNVNDSVNIKLLDTTRHLLICYTTNTSCTPNITVTNNYKMTLNKMGIWRIIVVEYDKNNKKIGNTETYYAYVKVDEDEINNSSTNNNYQNTTSQVKVRASRIGINNMPSIGKYLVVFVESENKFSEVRFCYNVVNKGSTEVCNLDTTSASVLKHDGTDFFHPIEKMKTYYGTYSETNTKSFMFDLDGLDELYKNGDTSKDVIISFAIGAKQNNKTIYSNPIRVRMNMTKKVGIDSYWNSSFIK